MIKYWQTILPAVAVLLAIGGAVYHVQSESKLRSAIAEAPKVATSSTSAARDTFPASERYASNSSLAN